nr:alanine racemase [Acidobacteriota bacterium]
VEEVPRVLELLRRHPRLMLAGLLSHFAEADDLASPRTPRQEERFAAVLALLTEEERRQASIHMANSAAALYRPSSRGSLVRLGLALYGLDPVAGPEGLERLESREDPETRETMVTTTNGEPAEACTPRMEREGRGEAAVGSANKSGEESVATLRPVMSVRARIVQMREVQAGTPISYGGRMVTARRSHIAVVPVGYADGYGWRLGGRAQALVAGRRVPVAGSVTMDMTLLDVTGTGAEPGDEVVLLGRQGGEEISAAELARHAGTISWEILCHLGLRLPRRYLRGGQVEELVSRFSREDG